MMQYQSPPPPKRKKVEDVSISSTAEVGQQEGSAVHATQSQQTQLSLTTLPPDALNSILCRVPASDHLSLRKTCKCIREALDSDAYASERASTNWAEVSARLIPREELYDRLYPDGPEMDDGSYNSDDEEDDNLTEKERVTRVEERKQRWEARREEKRQEDIDEYYCDLGTREEMGCIGIDIEIKVDGRNAGEVVFVRIPREKGFDTFHEASDEYSRETQEVGWTLCDRWGRPKLRSIKEADNADGYAKYGGFLHVKRVRMKQAYRPADNTNIVTRALRAALTVPELDGEWTLATAICDEQVYLTKEEQRRRDSRFWERRNTRMTDEYSNMSAEDIAEEKKKFFGRLAETIRLDARTFLRVGWKQIPEVVNKDNRTPWFFAMPHLLRGSILSHEDAVAIGLKEPPNLPPGPTGVNEELFKAVDMAACSRKFKMDDIADIEKKLGHAEQLTMEDDAIELRSMEQHQMSEEGLLRLERSQESTLQMIEERKSLLETSREQLDDSRQNFSLIQQLDEDQRRGLDEETTTITDQLQQMEEFIATHKQQVQELRRGWDKDDKKMQTIRQEMAACRSKIEKMRRKHSTTTFEERCTEKKREINQEKEAIVDQIRTSSEKLKVRVTDLVNAKGASVKKSFALHRAAQFLITEYIDFMLELVPAHERKAAINDINMDGCTLLHCSLLGRPELRAADVYCCVVQHLLQLGANKDIVDAYGRTPLGQYRLATSDRSDYSARCNQMGIVEELDLTASWAPIDARMERILMPIRGETDADKDAKNNEQDDDLSEGETKRLKKRLLKNPTRTILIEAK